MRGATDKSYFFVSPTVMTGVAEDDAVSVMQVEILNPLLMLITGGDGRSH